MWTILVTGGAGFIGGNFVHRMVLSGRARVIVLDKLTYAGHRATLAPVSDHPNHRFVEGDIGDSTLVESLLREHAPNAVVNFAAESHVDRSIDSPAPFIETNIAGVYRLLEAIRVFLSGQDAATRDRFRFIQISTDEVFGDLGPGDGAFAETTPYIPSSPYAASKAAADHLVRAWCRTYDVPAIVTNCSNNYGPYQFPEKLIPLTILNALEGQALSIYGDGSQVRDWLHVLDHCRGVESVIERGVAGETYNLGGNNERTNLAVVKQLCTLVGEAFTAEPALADCFRTTPAGKSVECESLITFVADRPGHDRRYAIDTDKARSKLGFYPEIGFDEGLSSTVAWYMNNDSWWRAAMDERFVEWVATQYGGAISRD